ncbi:MAG: ion channel [Alphaproteobacteria bacterium]|jgi:hypothetical protein
MLTQLVIGGGMIALTTAIHAGFMMAGIGLLDRWGRLVSRPGHWQATAAVAAFVLVMFAAAVVEIWCWALLFIVAGAFDAAEPAMYFTTVTFTTLGYGDITLEPPLRTLAAICATNGIVMFGWTTALLFAVVRRAYFPDR